MSTDNFWFLAQTKPRAEHEAKLNLERQGYRTCLPIMRQSIRMASGYRQQLVPMFPGYIFLQLSDLIGSWYSVRSTRGVSRMVVFGAHPGRISADMMGLIAQHAQRSTGETASHCWSVGDNAEVFHGVFSGYEGVIESIDSKERITLLLRCAATFTRLTVSADCIKEV
jgi:transcriptional antiterminator RfaH